VSNPIPTITTAIAAHFNAVELSSLSANDTRYTNTGAQYINVTATATLPWAMLTK